MTSSAPPRTFLITAVCILVLLVMAIAIARGTGLIVGDNPVRYVGLLFGSLLVVAGNALPKLMRPSLSDTDRHQAARHLKSQRFAGWLLVLGGLASMALWVWAPEDIRILSASGTGLAAFVLTLLVAAWLLRGKPFTSGQSEDAQHHRDGVIRRALFQILHALAWCFAMFIASDLWGMNTVFWLLIGFTVSMSALDSILTKSQPGSQL